jgi:hypothetical protein
MVLETTLGVLSKSNTGIAWQRKLDEYWRLQGLQYVLLVDSEFQAATLYTHATDTPAVADWLPEDADGLDHTFALPAIDCTLSIRAIYEGLDLPAPARNEPRHA